MKSLLLSLAVALAGTGAPAGDPILQAMSDEITRSASQLKIEKHDRPYYISYLINDSQSLDLLADFGAVVRDQRQQGRDLTVDVHVGNLRTDSGNMPQEFMMPGSLSNILLPFTDDYNSIRRFLWLKTDAAYKRASQQLDKKKSDQQQMNIEDKEDDWTTEEPVVSIEPKREFAPDRDLWRKNLLTLSNIFKDYPKISGSSAHLFDRLTENYFVNTEGSKRRYALRTCVLTVDASARRSDGLLITDSFVTSVSSDRKLPACAELEKQIRKMVQGMSERLEAKSAENYQGPVLMEGSAAGEFFAHALAPNVVLHRRMHDEFEDPTENHIESRLGRRILPPYISVIDDPQLRDSEGDLLPSSQVIDEEGVTSKKVILVEKGMLKTLLSTRMPSLKIKKSTGHAVSSYGGGNPKAWATNLVIQTSEQHSSDELRAKLLELGKSEGLDYVLVVRKFSDNSLPTVIYVGGAGEPDKDEVQMPLAVDVWKVYVADGHEERLRDAHFSTTTMRCLRDIAMTGSDAATYEMDEQGTLMSVTTPSIVVTDMEVRKQHMENYKPPELEHPYFDKQK